LDYHTPRGDRRNVIEPFVAKAELWRGHLGRVRTHVQRGGLFAAGVLTVLVALLLYNMLTPAQPQLTTQEVEDSIAQALASATPPPALSARVYGAVWPSLVFIETQAQDENGEEGFALGSGVIVNESGVILTSLHVVAGASDIRLTFADGSESGAQIAVAQPENDIAVLLADEPPAQLTPAVLGSPNAIRVGDEAFVVGNPLGLYSSMSAGVISGLDRSFKPVGGEQRLEGLIQFDAAVNPGNSGGPLLNRAGQVVGIVTALANPTEQDFFIGIGFAVPINVAGAAAGLPPY
jgi:S1-C subfamily serine protease